MLIGKKKKDVDLDGIDEGEATIRLHRYYISRIIAYVCTYNIH